MHGTKIKIINTCFFLQSLKNKTLSRNYTSTFNDHCGGGITYTDLETPFQRRHNFFSKFSILKPIHSSLTSYCVLAYKLCEMPAVVQHILL